ncbi:type I-E CRISPR-associated protein Cas5/CasD [Kitasatospora sp. NPDC056076]|uniref:type I-E CRISPR-associated protein Cas5/CasD n=1 Tax=Kitasatospora sp. NPDC056076 TaxID=3345703 RepID=UPI0035D753FC
MTSSLLLSLTGPMQSWGVYGRGHAWRDTHTHPTKSGVTGMCAAALGIERGDDISHLAALDFAVRVDRPGGLLRDYQTAGSGEMPLLAGDMFADPQLAKATPKGETVPTNWSYGAPRQIQDKGTHLSAAYPPKGRQVVPIERFYLSDAVFTVALGGDRELLQTIADAFDEPVYVPVLGRRNCPPTGDVVIGIVDSTPVDALADAERHPRADRGLLTVWTTCAPGEPGAQAVADDPEVFRSGYVDHLLRYENQRPVDPPASTDEYEIDEAQPTTEADPIDSLWEAP